MSARLIENMPFEDYLAHPALSASGMKRLLDSPARFQWEREHPTETPTILMGRLIHALAFDQPHNYIIKDWDGRTTAGKARAAQVREQGLDVVSDDDWAVATGIASALHRNPLASHVLFGDGVKHEVSAFWTDEETGVELKCRFDALGRVIGDLKSTTYARPDAMAKSSATYGYYLSAAQYVAGAIATDQGLLEFILVNAEKARPHFLSVTGVSDYDMQLAEHLRRKAIRLYAECVESDRWPDYTEQIEYPDAPGWWRWQVEELTGMNTETKLVIGPNSAWT